MSLIHIEESQLCKYWRYWEPLILQFALGKELFFAAPSILPFDLNSSVITLWPADVLFKKFPSIFVKVQIFDNLYSCENTNTGTVQDQTNTVLTFCRLLKKSGNQRNGRQEK